KLRRIKPAVPKSGIQDVIYTLTESGRQIDRSSIPVRNTVMHKLLEALSGNTQLDAQQARKMSVRATKLLKQWTAEGWVEEKQCEILPDTNDSARKIPLPELTLEQSVAVNSVVTQFNQFNTWLLHGVT